MTTFLAKALGENISLSLEELSFESKDEKYLYVLLTDTKTRFSKISQLITGQPFNHVSLMLDYNFDVIYTYTLSSPDSDSQGGFMIENKEDLKGSKYSLYSMAVSETAWQKVKDKVEYVQSKAGETSYNLKSLVNAVFNNVFLNKDKENDLSMICSEFVVTMLEESGVSFKNSKGKTIMRPYDLVKHKSLKHVELGTI